MGWHHHCVVLHCHCHPHSHPAICCHLLVPCISGCPLSPAFFPVSSSRGLCPLLCPCSLLTICNPPHDQWLPVVEWDPQVILGIRLSLGCHCPPGLLALSPSPCPCCCCCLVLVLVVLLLLSCCCPVILLLLFPIVCQQIWLVSKKVC